MVDIDEVFACSDFGVDGCRLGWVRPSDLFASELVVDSRQGTGNIGWLYYSCLGCDSTILMARFYIYNEY